MSEPLISILMPLYNEERFLDSALDSLLAQEEGRFELLVSDNASTDGTWDLLQSYAKRDRRIVLARQPSNIGAARNGQSLIPRARGRYAMVAAGHDLWNPRFIKACLGELEADASLVMAYPRAGWIDIEGRSLGTVPGNLDTRGLDSSARLNVVLWGLAYSYQAYGLYRREAFRAIPAEGVLAVDNLFLAGAAMDGAFAQVPETLFSMRRLGDFGSWESYVAKIFGRGIAQTGRSPRQLYYEMVQAFQSLIAARIPPGTQRDALIASVTHCLMTRYIGILAGIEGAGAAAGLQDAAAHVSDEARRALAFVQRRAAAPKVVVDGVFFQMYRTGIARVWQSLLEEWSKTDFAKQLVVADRDGTAPKHPGIRYVQVPRYDYGAVEQDRRMLQELCDREGASVFVSTYYTTPLITPSVFMAYDMIPEVTGLDMANPMWAQKTAGVRHASSYISISDNTARDLQRIYPNAAQLPMTVAKCGVGKEFRPASKEEIAAFRKKHGITRPYFMLSGTRGDHKNAILFFKAFAQLPDRERYEVVCTGGAFAQVETEFAALAAPAPARVFALEDEELRAAYSGALALAYPSRYEGFGLPVLEAMGCGCPVITTRCASIPEVAGEAVLYVDPDDLPGMRAALDRVQQPAVRDELARKGVERARLFDWKAMAETVSRALVAAAERAPAPSLASPAAPAPQLPEWNEKLVAEVRSAAERYRTAPQDSAAEATLREMRRVLANAWIALPADGLQGAYGGPMGAVHRALLESGIGEAAFVAEEAQLLERIQARLAAGLRAEGALNHLLAGMLYQGPHGLLTSIELAAIPAWFMADFLTFTFRAPRLFRGIGEVEGYRQYLENWLGYVQANIAALPGNDFWGNVAAQALDKLNVIPLYFTDGNTRRIYELRARILEHAVTRLGYRLDHEFAPRAAGAKPRIGILAAHFGPQTETWATLPVYQHLDRSRAEVILIAANSKGHPLERYCAGFADRLVVLPEDLGKAVQAIRDLDLDAIWIGTNLASVTHGTALLGAHRLARVQMTGGCSPATTGLRHVDVFVSGTLTEPAQGAQDHYTERLELVRGIAHCFDMDGEPRAAATQRYTRATLRLEEGKPVFISGANFYKIIPELEAAWFDILAGVPDARLVLYPFNPNWSSQYPVAPFLARLSNAMRARGMDPGRINVLMPLKARADILELLRLADVYLDSFPHSGMTSLLDPLEVGLPVVVRDGDTQRSRMGSATLRTIGMEELIAPDAAGYVQLAARLARDQAFRRACSEKIKRAMAAKPRFLDTKWYGGEMQRIFDAVLAARSEATTT